MKVAKFAKLGKQEYSRFARLLEKRAMGNQPRHSIFNVLHHCEPMAIRKTFPAKFRVNVELRIGVGRLHQNPCGTKLGSQRNENVDSDRDGKYVAENSVYESDYISDYYFG